MGVADDEVLVHNACPNKSNYRQNFKNAHPNMPSNYQVHHSLPQKYADTMKQAGINIHENQYLRGVDPAIHSKITNEWQRWGRNLGRTPTAQDIIDFAQQIDIKYGAHFIF